MTSSLRSESDSTSFFLLDPRIQRWIWQSGWTELKDAQELAVPVILEGNRDVIIAAATASGKTEAAFFPILTRLLAEPVAASALYISPLKALINDQWRRLDDLCRHLEMPVVPWHGDISPATKRSFLRKPLGCVLITPESLEGLLMREGHALSGLFGGLKYIVVDELHAFLDSARGKQLQSLMHRLDVALDRRISRVGLSATLGDMSLAAEFLRPDSGGDVEIVESRSTGQDLKIGIYGYYNDPPRLSDEEIESIEAEGRVPDMEDTLPAGVVAIGERLFATLRGSNNLVFPNSRRNVELYADLLRRKCEQLGVPNEFWPHHGSLSKEIREDAERALKEGERPATAIATTTLELGIDIGAVRSIAQVGPAPSVASLRQRLGRSGRRKGESAILRSHCLEDRVSAESSHSDRLREGLVQSIAQVQLLTERWFEPPRTQALHLSTLVQQLLSLVAQYGGITASHGWTLLCSSGVFPTLSKSDFAELLRELGRREVLVQHNTGLLLYGPVGERIASHYTFLATFQSVEEFTLFADGRNLGTLPLDRPVSEGSYLIFAGRRWQVTGCSQEDRRIDVVPAGGGKPPQFDGTAGKVHDAVRTRMKAVLAGDDSIAYLDAIASAQLDEARRWFRLLHLDANSALQAGTDTLLFTWRGDWTNDTLALLLTSRGLRATNCGIAINVERATSRQVQDVLRAIADAPPPKPTALVAAVGNKYLGKWDGLLPDRLLAANYAASSLDVASAVACAAAL